MVGVGIAAGKAAAPIDITHLVRRGLRIIGSFGARTRTDMPEIIRLAAQGVFQPAEMVTRRFTLTEADEAYQVLARGEIVGRAIVMPDQRQSGQGFARPDRPSGSAVIEHSRNTVIEQGTLLNFVGGQWQRADVPENRALHNPATGAGASPRRRSRTRRRWPGRSRPRRAALPDVAPRAARRSHPAALPAEGAARRALHRRREAHHAGVRQDARRGRRASCSAASRTSKWPPASRR